MIQIDRANFLASDRIHFEHHHGNTDSKIKILADIRGAKEALIRGEKVGLTVNGKLYSTIQQDGDEYTEKRVNNCQLKRAACP